ncbi:hypothetical protein HYR99_12310 [Candidatus Poribacteria bacterium]|nr:hypothetical protein [Candidatus Poribacteria bacterium]
MVEIKDEGICRFCLKTFAGRSMGRHLVACKVKKQQDSESAAKGKKASPIYHLKVWSYKPFWLHIEAKSTAKLSDLDRFLRRIWLECCGHLSEFTINGVRYSADMDDDWGDMESKSINVSLGQVLNVKDPFEYEYDFGSTTHLQGQVVAEREGVQREKIRILARNVLPQFPCDVCGAEATQIDVENEKLYCDKCFEAEFGEEYEMSLPVVNSPRMGVCGYAGESDFDDFSPQVDLES